MVVRQLLNTEGDLRYVTVQANQDAGFSIVHITGQGTTEGHGLGVAPDVIIIKRLKLLRLGSVS